MSAKKKCGNKCICQECARKRRNKEKRKRPKLIKKFIKPLMPEYTPEMVDALTKYNVAQHALGKTKFEEMNKPKMVSIETQTDKPKMVSIETQTGTVSIPSNFGIQTSDVYNEPFQRSNINNILTSSIPPQVRGETQKTEWIKKINKEKERVGEKPLKGKPTSYSLKQLKQMYSNYI